MVNKHPIIRAFALINRKRSHRTNYETGFGVVIAFLVALLTIRLVVNLFLAYRLAPRAMNDGLTSFLLVNFALLLVYGCSISALMIYRTQRDFLFHTKILTAPVNRQSIVVAFLQAALLRVHSLAIFILAFGTVTLVMSLTSFQLAYLVYFGLMLLSFVTGLAIIFIVALKTRLQINDLEYLVVVLLIALVFANPTIRITNGYVETNLFNAIRLVVTDWAWPAMVWLATILFVTGLLSLIRLVHLLAGRMRHTLKLAPAVWSYFVTIPPIAWIFIYVISVPILFSKEVETATKTYVVFFIVLIGFITFTKYKSSLENRIQQAWSLQLARDVQRKVLFLPFLIHILLLIIPLLGLISP